MKDIELQAARSAFEAWMRVAHPGVDLSRRVDGSYWSSTPDSFFDGFLGGWNHRASIEADRAQRVPETVYVAGRTLIDAARRDWPSTSAHRARVLAAASYLESAMLASTPAQPAQQPVERKPMTDAEREQILKKWRGGNWSAGDIMDAVERHHGIKE